jgi:hypothetical protein
MSLTIASVEALAGGAVAAAIIQVVANRRLSKATTGKTNAEGEHILVDASTTVIQQLVDEQARFKVQITDLATGLAACEAREHAAIERDRLSRKREQILRNRVEELETEVKALTIWTPGRTHLPRKDAL